MARCLEKHIHEGLSISCAHAPAEPGRLRCTVTIDSQSPRPLLLGYTQVIGYVRLNAHLGAHSLTDGTKNALWRNTDYLNEYTPADMEEKTERVAQTPFFKRKNLVKVWDFASLDAATCHDLAYGFGTLCDARPPDAGELEACLRPFYVTLQHLLFYAADSGSFDFNFKRPGRDLPPLYNARLPAAGTGLVSLCYVIAVGVSEEIDGIVKKHTVYFPMDVAAGWGVEREWFQRDYLGETIVDKTWDEAAESGKRTKESLILDLDRLIESDVHAVAANERRKSHSERPLGVSQIPNPLKAQFQIRVNNTDLCSVELAKPVFQVGDEVPFFLTLHDSALGIVGYTCYIEAREEYASQLVHTYNVTPPQRSNVFAVSGTVGSSIHLPRHIAQQFQASLLLRLRYVLVLLFVLGERGSSAENEGTNFHFSVPLTILP